MCRVVDWRIRLRRWRDEILGDVGGGRPGTGTTPTNAVSYFDANNWTDGSVPQGEGVRADLPETIMEAVRKDGLRFVFADRALTLGKLYVNRSNASQPTALANRACFVSDFGLAIANGKADDYQNQSLEFGGRVYADVTSSQKTVFTSLLSELCGDVTLRDDATLYIGGASTRVRLDYYAKDSNPVRVDPLKVATVGFDAADFMIYAPCGADEQVGSWSQTAGSPYLFRTGGEAHPLAVGTVVGGTGIPDGTFLKRVFSDSMIELSAAVTATVEGNAVTFAAFTPKVRQHLSSIIRRQNTLAILGLIKYRPQDELRVEIDRADDYRTLQQVTTDNKRTDITMYPGTLVLHDFSVQGVPVQLGDCHLEFAETGVEGLPGGFTNENAFVSSMSASSVSRITVTNGLEAVLYAKGLKGTLVKDGAGTLHLGFNADFDTNTGTISVEDGVLDLTCADADGRPSIGKLVIAAAATVRIPAQGLRVGTLEFEEGATVDGAGSLEVGGTMQEYLETRAKLTLTGGASLGFVHPGSEVYYEAPTPTVPGNPAFWVDVSEEGALTTSDASGVTRVTRIADVRGEGYPYATAAGVGPELALGRGGKPQHVYFEYVKEASKPEETHALMWSEPLTKIYSVFKVMNAREGGGQLLGGSPFRRGAGYGFAGKLFSDSVVRTDRHPELATADYLVNGQVMPHESSVSGSDLKLTEGFPYPGGVDGTPTVELVPLVAELHVAGGIRRCTYDHSDAIDNFDSEFNSDGDKGRNGGQRMYECIVYTNELTETEKLQIRGYLMRKWLNAEPNFERTPDAGIAAGAVDAATAGTFAIAAGTSADIASLSGSGTFTKAGAGALYVDDLADASTDVDVKGGTLTVRSFACDRASLPDGAALHVDAADLDTMTIEAGGSRMRVKEWRDWRGSDYPVLKQTASAQGRYPEYDKAYDSSSYVKTVVNGVTLPCSEDMINTEADLSGTTGFKFTLGGTDEVYTIPDVHSIFGLYYNGCCGKAAAQTIIPLGSANGKMPGEDGHVWGFLPIPGKLWNETDGYTRKTLYRANKSGGSLVLLNGRTVDPTATSYDAGANTLSVVAYEEIGASALFSFRKPDGKWGSGTFCIGEVILYRTALSHENVNRVEAYLQKKWYNQSTPGYRPAVAGDVKVAAGATLNVYGTAPLMASSVSCSGTINGSVTLTEGALIEIPVAADGTVPAFSISGKIDASKGGTIRLVGTGARAQVGRYTVLAASSFAAPLDPANWTLEVVGDFGKRTASLQIVDGAVVADVRALGLTVIVR